MSNANGPRFVKVLETDSLTDIALIKGALDAAGINYFFQGENMKFIRPGDQPACLMVADGEVDKVVALLGPLKLKYVGGILGSHPQA